MEGENKELDNLMDHLKKDDKPVVEKKLAFDFSTGELRVADKPKEGEVVVDQIYKDGFFAMVA